MVKRKLVVVPVSGPLCELQGKLGPLRYPTRITIRVVAEMVKNGKKVYECDPLDPENKDKRILLTSENVNKDNFGGDKKADINHSTETNVDNADKQQPEDFPEIKPAGPVSIPKEDASVVIPEPPLIGVDPATEAYSTVVPDSVKPVECAATPTELVIGELEKVNLTSETPDNAENDEKSDEQPDSQIPTEKTVEETKKEDSKVSDGKQTGKRNNKGKGTK